MTLNRDTPEAEADDGAIFRFWEWLARQGERFDLDNVEVLKTAVARFDREEASHDHRPAR